MPPPPPTPLTFLPPSAIVKLVHAFARLQHYDQALVDEAGRALADSAEKLTPQACVRGGAVAAVTQACVRGGGCSGFNPRHVCVWGGAVAAVAPGVCAGGWGGGCSGSSPRCVCVGVPAVAPVSHNHLPPTNPPPHLSL